jgi:hypothetical protein
MATSLSAGHCVASAASSCWLAKESKGVVVVAAGFLLRAERGDVVLLVDRKRLHNLSPWCRVVRGHDIDHSEVLEKQGDCAINRRRRRSGDGGQTAAQMRHDELAHMVELGGNEAPRRKIWTQERRCDCWAC